MKPKSLGMQGTALLESLSVMSVLPILVSAGVTTCYISFARFWIERESYEAVVCLGSLSRTADCEKDFRRRVDRVLPFGRLRRLHVTRNAKSAAAEIDFELLNRSIAVVKVARNLPLSSRGAR